MSNKSVKTSCIFLVVLICFSTAAKTQDSTHVSTATGYFISGSLIVGGTIVNKDATKRGFRDWVRRRLDVPKTGVDDVLQHTPILMMYIGDLALRNDKTSIARHTRHMLVSQVLTLGTMLVAKGVLNNPRPNGGSHAMPSGHTAYSFASANVMYHSFKEDHLWLAYSGYIPAIAVGAYRIIKDKHWISDVLVGAGMGILFSHLTYHLDIWNSSTNRGTNNKSMSSISLGMAANGVGLSVKF